MLGTIVGGFIAIVVLCVYVIIVPRTERYRSCNDCGGRSIPRFGVSVLNPYVWPYSGGSCVNDMYVINRDHGIDIDFAPTPSHLSTPDHVELA